ncbi:diacylglycerol kinase [Terrabacter sp. Root181]|uniref:diacylglycerol kinase n=1 Tax=Terrabacter sp. Root181 TaxID=1736484 RepID=UPI0006FC6E72|nr:diacylglycerol kinase [Terrabacter sp. Root181]KRB45467.1 sphingosine kinase [Terrabacter sp. Root181]
MSHRVALIVNPTSGKGVGREIGDQTRRLLHEAGHDVVDVSGSDYQQARSRAREAVSVGVDTVVVVGGDGMVHLGVNLCAGTSSRLALVAAGTGNDFARNLGLPIRDARAAVALLTEGRTRDIDLGRVSHGVAGEKWFGGVLGAGFDAVVNARAQRMTWPRGQMRYNLAVLRELPVFRPIPYAVELDGHRLETRAMLVAVANTTSFGGGMRVCPDADVTDGLFDVLIVHALSIPSFLRVFPKVYSGTHTTHPAVEILRARRVRLEASGIHSQADGETFADLPIDAEVVPGALHVVTPKEVLA